MEGVWYKVEFPLIIVCAHSGLPATPTGGQSSSYPRPISKRTLSSCRPQLESHKQLKFQSNGTKVFHLFLPWQGNFLKAALSKDKVTENNVHSLKHRFILDDKKFEPGPSMTLWNDGHMMEKLPSLHLLNVVLYVFPFPSKSYSLTHAVWCGVHPTLCRMTECGGFFEKCCNILS